MRLHSQSFFRRIKHHSGFFLGLLLSYLFVTILADALIDGRVSFLDTPGYVLSFSFISDHLNGGIQLWNRYNQMPNAFKHFQFGYYDLHKFLLGFYLSVFDAGSITGSDFRTAFIQTSIALSLFIQTFGLYVLLKRFTQHKFIIVIAILYGNILLSIIHYTNPTTSNVISFFPLIVYLGLKVFEDKMLKDLGWFLLVLAIIFSFSPYHVLNVIYLPLHLLAISGLVFNFVFSDYGRPYRATIGNAISALFVIYRSFLRNLIPGGQGPTQGVPVRRNPLAVMLRRNAHFVALDFVAILVSFYVVWMVRAINEGNSLSGDEVFSAWLTSTPWIVTTFLLVNFSLGIYYSQRHRELIFLNVGRLTAAGYITSLLLTLLTQRVSIGAGYRVIAAGCFISVGMLILTRYGNLRCARDFTNQSMLLAISIGQWIHSTIGEIKVGIAKTRGRTYLFLALAAVLSILVLLPNLLMLKDVYPSASFDSSRIDRITPLSYFEKNHFLAAEGVRTYPFLSINHLQEQYPDSGSFANRGPVYARSFTFLGVSTIFFILAALLWSQDRRKYTFLTAYLLLLFLNTEIPVKANPLHILNATTNPFAFTNRSFHFLIIALGPIFLVPIVALGMQALIDFLRRPVTHVARSLLIPFSLVSLLIIILLLINFAPIRLYIHIFIIIGLFFAIFGIIMYLRWSVYSRQSILLGLFALIFIFEGSAWSTYISGTHERSIREPAQHLLLGRVYAIDAVSPAVLPLREYFSNLPFAEILPEASRNDRHEGMYYQFVDLDRLQEPRSQYFAAHSTYDSIVADSVYTDYLSQIDTLFAKTTFAAMGTEDTFRDILIRGLINEVVALDIDQEQRDELVENGKAICSFDSVEQCTNAQGAQVGLQEDFIKLDIPLASARQIGGSSRGFQLHIVSSEGIPSYLSTVLFTKESSRLTAWVNDQELHPVQGEIIEPYSFDVHNMVNDGIVLSLPRSFEIDDAVLKIYYQQRFQAGIMDVYLNTHDRLGLLVESDSEGWLLYHSPFDEDWKATINGEPTPIYRANGAFMAVPLENGLSRIEFSFMPGSLIRPLIFLSLLISLATVVVLIFKTLSASDEIH